MVLRYSISLVAVPVGADALATCAAKSYSVSEFGSAVQKSRLNNAGYGYSRFFFGRHSKIIGVVIHSSSHCGHRVPLSDSQSLQLMCHLRLTSIKPPLTSMC
jgi:hypothetical protein